MNSGQNFSSIAAFIWAVADLLRGDFKQSQYGRVILSFTLLRRLECVLEPTKAAVLEQHQKTKEMPEEAARKLLLHATKQPFFNPSPMDLDKLGQNQVLDNLDSYIQSFSPDAREIFDYFSFSDDLAQLNDAKATRASRRGLLRRYWKYSSVDTGQGNFFNTKPTAYPKKVN